MLSYAKTKSTNKEKPNKLHKKEDEIRLKKQKQEQARKEINEFLKNRQAEVEELKIKNLASSKMIVTNDPLKDNVKLWGEFLVFDHKKHCIEGWRLSGK